MNLWIALVGTRGPGVCPCSGPGQWVLSGASHWQTGRGWVMERSVQ